MNCNIGSLDKTIRKSIGMMIIGLGFYFKSWWGIVGVFPIIVSYINYCPIYTPFKINTKRKEDEHVGIN